MSNSHTSLVTQRFTLGVRLYYKVMEEMLKSVSDLLFTYFLVVSLNNFVFLFICISRLR